MDKRNLEVIDGNQAQQLLDNPIYRKSVQQVRDGIVSAMGNSAMGDNTTHNRLVIALQLLNQIEKNITTFVQTGKMAEIQLSESVGDKVRRILRG